MKRGIAGSLLAIAGTVACAGSPPANSPPGHQAGEEAAVLRVLDRYMKAISEQDLDAMAAMQLRDGMTYRARPDGRGGTEIVGRPNSWWIDPARKGTQTNRERYWSPTVLIRGSLAVVWAPYEFWIDGKTSHCGIDVFDFARVEGEWRVANSMWTVEPGACAELRPADAAAVRPAD